MKWRCIFYSLCVLFVQTDGIYYKQFLKDVEKHLPRNSPCFSAINALVANMNDTTDLWAPKMLDASSKFPMGAFGWNYGEMGNFEECLNAKSKSGVYKGKHCQGSRSMMSLVPATDEINPIADKELIQSLINDELDFKARIPSFAICVPDQCQENDIKSITADYDISFHCFSEEDFNMPLTNGAKFTLYFLGSLLLLMLISTVYSVYSEPSQKGPLSTFLLAFSIKTNGGKLFTVSKNTSEITCIYGIRVLCSMWIILNHVYNKHVYADNNTFNEKYFFQFRKSPAPVPILLVGFAVETFFTVGGMVLALSFFSSMAKGNGFNIFKYYLHRYFRLTPVLAATILIAANVLPYLGSGPLFKHFREEECDTCKTDWWKILLYMQKYDFGLPSCIGHAWYLICDFQLYLLSPLILLPLWNKPKLGISIILAALLSVTIWTSYVVYSNKLWHMPNNIGALMTNPVMLREYHVRVYTRSGTWLLGILLGYVVHLIRTNGLSVKLSRVSLIATWLLILGTMLSILFVPYVFLSGPEYYRVTNALAMSLLKLIWGCCISSIILLCITGNGGIINWVLSLPIFQILNRLTFSIYLLHMYLIKLKTANARMGMEFSLFNIIFDFCGYATMSFLLSIVWVLAFEMPIAALEKPLFNAVGLGEKPKSKKA